MRNNSPPSPRAEKRFFKFLVYGTALVLFLAALAMLYPLYRNLQNHRAELAEIRQEEDRKRDDVAEMRKFNAELNNSPRAAEKVAREKFGLCRDGESVLTFTPPPASGTDKKQ